MSEKHLLDYCGGALSARHESALSAQRPFPLPGDQPHYARDRLVDIRHIKLEIDIDPEAKRIEATVHTTFAPINDGVSYVEFDAVEMQITRVRLSGRKTAPPYSYDGERLRIELGPGRRADERLTTSVSYTATPRRGLYFVAPD